MWTIKIWHIHVYIHVYIALRRKCVLVNFDILFSETNKSNKFKPGKVMKNI